MHESFFSPPMPALAPFVRFYVQRRVEILGPAIVHPVPARAVPLIEFDFGDPVDVRYAGQSALVKSPKAVVVGAQTFRRVEMHLRGVLESFVIMFQPTGLHGLFSIPMSELTNLDFEADAVLGKFATQAWQRLGECESFAGRMRIVEDLLLKRLLRLRGESFIGDAARRIMLSSGHVSVPLLADTVGLSVRQFERRFKSEVGIRPKLFARVSRFEAALDYKARAVSTPWTDVAQRFGYYDHMHMVHDFSEFTGGTPSNALRELETVYVEQIRSMRAGTPSKTAHADSRFMF